MSQLIEERQAAYVMWRRLAGRRKPGSRSYWRAHAQLYAAALLLESAYRLG